MSTHALPPQEEQKKETQNGKPTPGEANMDPPTVTDKLNGNETSSKGGRTFALQHKLPKLPVPPLKDTCERYLRALKGLQVRLSTCLF
jgi:hypothetical protein